MAASSMRRMTSSEEYSGSSIWKKLRVVATNKQTNKQSRAGAIKPKHEHEHREQGSTIKHQNYYHVCARGRRESPPFMRVSLKGVSLGHSLALGSRARPQQNLTNCERSACEKEPSTRQKRSNCKERGRGQSKNKQRQTKATDERVSTQPQRGEVKQSAYR